MGWPDKETIAINLGFFAAFCFTLQYFPQTWLNYQRKTIKGFSTRSIILKHIGACFLAVNATLVHERLPAILYGMLNILQHSIFMLQFTYYLSDVSYLLWLGFPLLPYVLGLTFPASVAFTNYFKPAMQIASHFPQLWLSYKEGTTAGVSLMTQHLNVLGGLSGIYMCTVLPPVSFTTWLLYFNSTFQAVSLYTLAIWMDKWPFSDRRDRIMKAKMDATTPDSLDEEAPDSMNISHKMTEMKEGKKQRKTPDSDPHFPVKGTQSNPRNHDIEVKVDDDKENENGAMTQGLNDLSLKKR